MRNSNPFTVFFGLLASLMLYACNGSDSVIDLVGGYQLVDEGPNDHSIIGPQLIGPDVTRYYYDADFILAEQKLSDGPFIAEKGERLFEFFNRFSSENSATNPDSLRLFQIFLRRGADTLDRQKHDNVVIAYEIADSIVHTPSFQERNNFTDTSYYIITLSGNRLIGPLSKSEFQYTRKSLNIPETVSLIPLND